MTPSNQDTINLAKSLLQCLLARQDLSAQQSQQMLAAMISGELPPEWLAALLIALEAKGVAEQEILGAAKAMRDAMVSVQIADKTHSVDTCGTGGDDAGTFNVSTASALVAAAAGAKVAKHGNRSVSSASGSADLLVQAGAKLELTADQVRDTIAQVGFGFMFAPMFHPAMKHVAPVRRSLGVKTLFNLLGPLANPARVVNQVIGVYQADLLPLFASVLAELGSQHVLLVHAEDGLDEISIAALTKVVELKDGAMQSFQIKPEDFGFSSCALAQIRVKKNAEQSLALVRSALLLASLLILLNLNLLTITLGFFRVLRWIFL